MNDNCPIILPPPRPWRSPSCKGCGQLIALERRRRYPHARTCGLLVCMERAARAASRRRSAKHRRGRGRRPIEDATGGRAPA